MCWTIFLSSDGLCWGTLETYAEIVGEYAAGDREDFVHCDQEERYT